MYYGRYYIMYCALTLFKCIGKFFRKFDVSYMQHPGLKVPPESLNSFYSGQSLDSASFPFSSPHQEGFIGLESRRVLASRCSLRNLEER
jgi:hypothetical protein